MQATTENAEKKRILLTVAREYTPEGRRTDLKRALREHPQWKTALGLEDDRIPDKVYAMLGSVRKMSPEAQARLLNDDPGGDISAADDKLGQEIARDVQAVADQVNRQFPKSKAASRKYKRGRNLWDGPNPLPAPAQGECYVHGPGGFHLTVPPSALPAILHAIAFQMEGKQ